MPHVAAAKATGKAAMGPRIGPMIAGIVTARIMAYPPVAVHVWRIGVAVLFAVTALRFALMRGAAILRRAVGWGRMVISGAGLRVGLPSLVLVLSKGGDCEDKERRQS